MAIQKYTDANGNEIEVDDTITALGPHPNLIGTSAEAPTPRVVTIRDPYGDRQRALEKESRKTSGWGNGSPSGVDDPEYLATYFPPKGRV